MERADDTADTSVTHRASRSISPVEALTGMEVIDLSVDISEVHPASYIYDPAYRADVHVT